jgi:hypothetical protein
VLALLTGRLLVTLAPLFRRVHDPIWLRGGCVLHRIGRRPSQTATARDSGTDLGNASPRPLLSGSRLSCTDGPNLVKHHGAVRCWSTTSPRRRHSRSRRSSRLRRCKETSGSRRRAEQQKTVVPGRGVQIGDQGPAGGAGVADQLTGQLVHQASPVADSQSAGEPELRHTGALTQVPQCPRNQLHHVHRLTQRPAQLREMSGRTGVGVAGPAPWAHLLWVRPVFPRSGSGVGGVIGTLPAARATTAARPRLALGTADRHPCRRCHHGRGDGRCRSPAEPGRAGARTRLWLAPADGAAGSATVGLAHVSWPPSQGQRRRESHLARTAPGPRMRVASGDIAETPSWPICWPAVTCARPRGPYARFNDPVAPG